MSATQRIIDSLKARNADIQDSWRPDVALRIKPGSSLDRAPGVLRREQESNTEKIERLERSAGSHGAF